VFKISSQILPPKILILKIKEREFQVPNQINQTQLLAEVLRDLPVLLLNDLTVLALKRLQQVQAKIRAL
jgi:hypothetical protein